MHVVAPISRPWLLPKQVGKTAGHRLNWSQRIIQLVTQHAQQSLPGATFFFAQRLAQIRQDEQLMLRAPFAKGAASNVPATHPAGKDHLHRVLAVALLSIQAGREA